MLIFCQEVGSTMFQMHDCPEDLGFWCYYLETIPGKQNCNNSFLLKPAELKHTLNMAIFEAKIYFMALLYFGDYSYSRKWKVDPCSPKLKKSKQWLETAKCQNALRLRNGIRSNIPNHANELDLKPFCFQ